MRGKILLKALEFLCQGAMNQVYFFGAVLAAGYGASSSRINYEYNKRRRISEDGKEKIEALQNSRRRLTIFISKMKHDGLIETENNKFKISGKGIDKLNKLRNNLPGRFYERNHKGNSVIISFDIPERLRRKRNWLREVIRNFGFRMIHQSVWMGKGKVPKDFIEDLENLKILEFVEIFEISKTGSLKKIT
ncbi:MAG: hypothetical protein WC735_02425 [Candidatus Paceibacterota bacterium]|jgi:hypothetical protein